MFANFYLRDKLLVFGLIKTKFLINLFIFYFYLFYFLSFFNLKFYFLIFFYFYVTYFQLRNYFVKTIKFTCQISFRTFGIS